MLQPLERSRALVFAVALAEAGLAELAQVGLGRLLVGRLKRGEAAAAQAQAFVVRLDQLGNSRRGGQGLFVARHGLVHLVGAAEIKLLGVELHPRRVVDRLAGVDAKQDVVRGRVFAGQVMGVAGRDHGKAHPPGDVDRPDRTFLLDSDAVVLNLDVEAVFAEDLLIPRAELLGLGRLVVKDVVGKLGRCAARRGR